MTTLRPPPNWYADPAGRHEFRYWDGFTWTAHVADRGAHGLDPLVRSVPVQAAPPDSAAMTPVGHGTARLREMAATPAGPAPATAPPAVGAPSGRSPRRPSLAYELSAVVAMVVVIVLGGFTLWQSWRTSDAGGRTDPTGSAQFRRPGYRVDLPPSWVRTPLPAAADADGAWTVIDRSHLVAVVGQETILPAATTDDAVLEQLVVDVVTYPFTAGGATTTVVDRGVVRAGSRRTGRAVVDVTAVDGTTVRAAEYVVVSPRGSVAVGIVGSADAVDRHLTETERVARTARIG